MKKKPQLKSIQELDRFYKDRRGIAVHVIRYDRINERVIFLRDDYEHGECVQPLWKFKDKFKIVDDEKVLERLRKSFIDRFPHSTDEN